MGHRNAQFPEDFPRTADSLKWVGHGHVSNGVVAMDKLYKVFVSSTSKDLLEERQRVMNNILRLGHLPVAMELFPTDPESPWQYLKRIIAECDYYVIILAGWYGSIVPGEEISFTEKEYDFAVESGIPVLAFAMKDVGQQKAEHVEKDPNRSAKLEAFRAKVGTRHTWRNWSNAPELANEVALSLGFTIKDHQRDGWVPAKQAMSAETLNELEMLRRRCAELESSLNETSPLGDDLARGDDTIALNFQNSTGPYADQLAIEKVSILVTWDEIFAALAPHMFAPISDKTIGSHLAVAFDNQIDEVRKSNKPRGHVSLEEGLAFQIAIQLIALGLAERVPVAGDVKSTFFQLSPKGEREALRILAIRK
jgi:hypothetical protein